jgi:hypothetical protein
VALRRVGAVALLVVALWSPRRAAWSSFGRGGRPQRTRLGGRTVLLRLLTGVAAGGVFGWAAMMVPRLLGSGPAPATAVAFAGGTRLAAGCGRVIKL